MLIFSGNNNIDK